jgi:hypothetical protein
MNDAIKKKMKIAYKTLISVSHDVSTKKVSFEIPEKRVILLTKPLSYMLGYHEDKVAINTNTTTAFQADLHGYYHDMYISDVLEYQLVGDVATHSITKS